MVPLTEELAAFRALSPPSPELQSLERLAQTGAPSRIALNDTIGEAGIGDRLGGAALGAVRVGLVATTLVLVFDRIVPANHQPPFLADSHLRPLFSLVGQMGFKSLPPEAAAAIDRLKQERHI